MTALRLVPHTRSCKICGCCFPPFALGEKCDAPATRGEWNVGADEHLLFCDVHGALNPDARDLPYAVALRAAMALIEDGT